MATCAHGHDHPDGPLRFPSEPPRAANPAEFINCGHACQLAQVHTPADSRCVMAPASHPDKDGCLGVPAGTRRWHGAYCRWFDHREAGHRLRAGLWGFVADRLVRWA